MLYRQRNDDQFRTSEAPRKQNVGNKCGTRTNLKSLEWSNRRTCSLYKAQAFVFIVAGDSPGRWAFSYIIEEPRWVDAAPALRSARPRRPAPHYLHYRGVSERSRRRRGARERRIPPLAFLSSPLFDFDAPRRIPQNATRRARCRTSRA